MSKFKENINFISRMNYIPLDLKLPSSILLKWHKTIDRDLPWKEDRNPYKIWLSEIILQQTRVEQGRSYYLKFVQNYPTIKDLANAHLDEILKDWEGLGYYSRARNLHFTAKYIVNELEGNFPDNFKSLKELKGVGDYTAAAIASFAYGLPHAVVDGNVYRVLARYFGDNTPIDSTEGKKLFAKLAQNSIDIDKPAEHNQAIMDFGALVCTPKKPSCLDCCFQKTCIAFKNNEVSELPVKAKKTKKRNRYFNFLVINYEGKYFIEQRMEKDIWQNLFQFPLLETIKEQKRENFSNLLRKELDLKPNDFEIIGVKKTKQNLSHQKIFANFVELIYKSTLTSKFDNWKAIKKSSIDSYAFPKTIDWYLKENFINLS